MVARKIKIVGMCLALSLAVAGLAFLALLFAIPPRGHIDIEYDGLSKSGVYWMLENRSTQTIYMQGTGDKVWPNSPITTCRTAAYSNESSDPVYLADGSPSLIRVPPGGHFRMNVATTLPNTYKGGHCYVRVTLLGGTFVESHEFTPN
ncbi:MAG TPA: hypothetical protein VN325_44040 [Steroidobacteraceae bacterium]|nr:hypothetical protein [Steroidobacteraceae bacterium]